MDKVCGKFRTQQLCGDIVLASSFVRINKLYSMYVNSDHEAISEIIDFLKMILQEVKLSITINSMVQIHHT